VSTGCFKPPHGPLSQHQTRTYGEVIMRLTPKTHSRGVEANIVWNKCALAASSAVDLVWRCALK